jgi:hypothetical protein
MLILTSLVVPSYKIIRIPRAMTLNFLRNK